MDYRFTCGSCQEDKFELISQNKKILAVCLGCKRVEPLDNLAIELSNE